MSASSNDCPPAPLSQWLEAAWSHPATIRPVEVEGATIRYRDWGTPPADRAPAGPAPGLVFVHGFLAHARWWDHIAPHFADRYHVIAPDFSGMGDSDRRPQYSRRQYARETLAAMRDAGMAGATIVCHSFGAVSSLLAAKLAPDMVHRVIVLDAFVFRADGSEPLNNAVEPEKRYATREDALARYRLKPPGQWPIRQIVDYLAAHSLRETDGQWGWKFDPQTFACVHSEGLRDELRGIATPVDFVRAANSDIIDDAALASFVANTANCGAPVTVPLSHHHLMIEQPVALVSALDGLLAHPR